MNGKILSKLGAAALAALWSVGCHEAAKEKEPAAPAEKSAAAESRVKHGTNGEVIVTLDAETQKVIGLKAAAVTAATLSPEVKGYGRVLEPATLSALTAEVASARATAMASQKELDRLKVLSAQDNASTRALQTAEAAAQRDTVLAESAWQRLLAAWGKGVAERAGQPAFVLALAAGEAALVQVNLPPGEILRTPPATARLAALADDGAPVTADFVGPAPSVDPQMQGQGLLFFVKPGQPRFAPGAAVSAFLPLPGEAQTGVSVPRNSVLRFNGATWVYLQDGDDKFVRTEVALERPLEDGWFVRENLQPGARVVVVGAQQLLSEELKGQIGE
jgi:hypothetical protein